MTEIEEKTAEITPDTPKPEVVRPDLNADTPKAVAVKAKKPARIEEIEAEGNGDVHVLIHEPDTQAKFYRAMRNFTSVSWKRPGDKKVTYWNVIDCATEVYPQGIHPDGNADTLRAKLRLARPREE